MLKQPYKSIALGTLCSAAFALPVQAAVPIEQRALTNKAMPNVATTEANTQGSTLWQLYQQVQQLQDEIRDLRGQIEGQQDAVDRTQKDLKNRYTDLDQRLEQLAQDAKQQEAESTEASTDETTTDTANNANATESENTTTSTNDAAPEESKPQPVATTNIPTPPVAPSNPLSNNQDTQPDRQAYVGAYEVYKAQGAAKAIAPMQQYINDYPNSVFVPNAYYWLGEFYLASNPVSFDKAKQNFSLVINKYPKSAKAASALYRLASITHTVDQRPQDALTLMRKLIRDYPNTQESNYAQSFIKSHSN
jgi:tol-pal system protein YbgF